MVARPTMRFFYNKRSKFAREVARAIKRIQQMNLIFLLHCRWKNLIEFIKFQYAKYRKIKHIRIQLLIVTCDKIAPDVYKFWKEASYNEKYDLASIYLLNELYKFSRVSCKYKADTRQINKAFSRNIFFLENQAISDGYGRNFRIAPPAKPFLRIFSQKANLLNFIHESDNFLMKKPRRRKSKNPITRTLPNLNKNKIHTIP